MAREAIGYRDAAPQDKPNQQVRNVLAKGDIFSELVLNPILNEFVETRLGP